MPRHRSERRLFGRASSRRPYDQPTEPSRPDHPSPTFAGRLIEQAPAPRSPFRASLARDHADIELAALAKAASWGRDHVARQLATWCLPKLVDDCALVTSELITNAISATAGPTMPDGPTGMVRLRVRLGDTHLGLEVWDSSRVPPAKAWAALDSEGGRGLVLVEALCTRWGTYPALWPRGGKVVFADFDLP